MKKDIIAFMIVIIAAALFIMNTDFKSVEDYYTEHAEDITEDCQTVFISVRCDSVLEHMDKLDKSLYDYIPSDGVILENTEYVLRDGDTVFDILKRAVALNKIQMEYKGADTNIYNTVYIEGIGYLYEFSCGKYSGWTYKVNGIYPQVGCSAYRPDDGDIIEWIYTLEPYERSDAE